MPRYLASVTLVLVVLAPFSAMGLGLGEIDLKSGLNQPFSAEIAVTSESASELTGVEVSLASKETFQQFGLDRPFFLTEFKFATVTRGGNTAIQISSAKPVIEPFVTLLLEIRWPQGRLLREYTVLLDPPAFSAAEAAPPVEEPVAGPAAIPAPEQIERAPAPAAPEPAPVPVLTESMAPEPPAPAPAASVPPVTAEPAEPARSGMAPVATQVEESVPAETTPVEPVRDERIPVEPQVVESSRAEPEVVESGLAESAPVEQVPTSAPAPVSSRTTPSTSAAAPDYGYGVVQKNDTLWAIAGRVSKDSAITRNQMMLAIYRANPEAFAGNINRLQAGAILRAPDAAELTRLDRRAAQQEFQRQVAEWKQATADEGRLRLVPPPEQQADVSPAVQTGIGVDTSGEQAELQQRIAALEGELADSQRLITVRDEELQAVQAQLAALQERLEAVKAAEDAGTLPVDTEAPDPFGVEEPVVDEAIVEVPVEGPVEATGEDIAPEVQPSADQQQAGEFPVGGPATEEPPLVDPIPSAVVTTAAPADQPSFIGALFTNVWLYVSLFVVLLLALFIARRRSAEPATDAWDEAVPVAEPSIDDLRADLAEPLSDAQHQATIGEALIVEDESPVERTIQDGELQGSFDTAMSTNIDDQEYAPEIADEFEADFLDHGIDAAEIDTVVASAPEPESQATGSQATGSFETGDLTAGEPTAAGLTAGGLTASDLTASELTPNELTTGELTSDDLGYEPEPTSKLEYEPQATGHLAFESDSDMGRDSESSGEFELPFERTISIASPANLDEADPIAEADFHMAYGLYDQAASLLTDAMAAEPDRQKDLRLKLLEVYFIWENAELFLQEAQTIKQELDDADPDWNKVLIMGKQICPDEELFAARAGPPGKSAEVDLAFSGDSGPEEDYDVDLALDDNYADAAGGGLDDALDFELGGPDAGIEDAGASTMETPTIESEILDPTVDMAAAESTLESTLESTMETPTIEMEAIDPSGDPTVDMAPAESTMETPTVDIARIEPETEMPDGESLGATPTSIEPTLDIAALGTVTEMSEGEVSDDSPSVMVPAVDMTVLEPVVDIPEGLGSQDSPSALETPTVEMAGLEATMETPTIKTRAPLDGIDEAGLDLMMGDEDSDDESLFSVSSVDLAAETLQIELDDDTQINKAAQDTVTADADDLLELDPTDVLKRPPGDGMVDQRATAEPADEDGIGDASTVTEVGTKLDLARAYIDMGDPDGARSILNEVIEEAGDSQRQEAQQLLAGLG